MIRQRIEQYRTWPRSARWLVWAGVGLIAYFALVEPGLGLVVRLHQQAASARAALEQMHEAQAERERRQAAVRRAEVRLGAAVAEPAPASQGAAALDARIAEVLRRHGVDSYTSQARLAPLRAGELSRVSGSASVARLVRDLRFEASPESAIHVLAELEQSPDVTSIASVELRRADVGRALRVALSLETWVLQPERSP